MSEPIVAIADVIAVVSAHYGVSVIALKSHRRAKAISHARHVAYHLARVLTEHSMPAIARIFGDRDHTTILYGLRRMDEALERDSALREEMTALTAAIIATARLRERQLIQPPKDVDPRSVAIRVAQGGERAAGAISIIEIRAVCEALADREYELETLRPRVVAAQRAAEALRAQRQALYTAQERDANARVDRALKELSNSFEKELPHG